MVITSMQKIKDSDFTVPRCTSHCFARFIFRPISTLTSKNLQVRWADGKYGHPNFRKPIWLVKGSRYGSNCQKSYSADVAEYKKPVYTTKLFEEEQFDLQNSDFSSKVFLPKETKKVCSNKTLQGGHKSKRYTENTSLSNIYRRFYWPGSYALRGVINQYICLQMGAPLFLLAFFRHKLGSNFNCGSRYSLINF